MSLVMSNCVNLMPTLKLGLSMCFVILLKNQQEVLDGLVAMISACQPPIASAGDLGSIPSQGAYVFFFFFFHLGCYRLTGIKIIKD